MIIRPSLNLDFCNAQQLGPLVNFSRPTTALRVDRTGKLVTAAISQPRFDFDPITGICKGLLLEEQRTNFIPFSSAVDNAAWTKVGVSVVPNAALAPDGTLAADRLQENSDNGQRRWYLSVSGLSGATSYTLSTFVKPDANRKGVTLYPNFGSDGYIADFDLENLTSAGAIIGAAVSGSSKIENWPGGWYRLYATVTFASVITGMNCYCYFSSDPTNGNASYVGDNASGILVWGNQLEAGVFGTSPIPVPSSTPVTRSADIANITSIAPWFTAEEGTFVVDASSKMTVPSGGDQTVLAMNNFSQNEQLDIRLIEAGITSRIRSGGVTLASLTPYLGTVESGAVHKLAMAYKQNAHGFSRNGEVQVTNTSVGVPTGLSRLEIGCRTSANLLNGHVKRLAHYPRRLSELEVLSA